MLNEIHQRLISKFVHAQINGEITLSNALEILKDEFVKDEMYKEINDLYNGFMECFNNPEIRKRTRQRDIVSLRHFFMYVCKERFKNKYTLRDIGAFISEKNAKKPYDHTTVIHANNLIKDLIKIKDEQIMSYIEKFTKYNQEKFVN